MTGVNQIMLYNLHAGTSSWWKGIKLCKERCENFNWSMLIIINLIIFLNWFPFRKLYNIFILYQIQISTTSFLLFLLLHLLTFYLCHLFVKCPQLYSTILFTITINSILHLRNQSFSYQSYPTHLMHKSQTINQYFN